MASSLTNIRRHTFAKDVEVAGRVFANAGGASSAGGCTAIGLSAGLSAELSSNNATCPITGAPTVAGSATAEGMLRGSEAAGLIG